MRARICDRCGKAYPGDYVHVDNPMWKDKFEGESPKQYPMSLVIETNKSKNAYFMDLCSSCWEEFFEWSGMNARLSKKD